MARADLIVQLIKAGTDDNKQLFRKTAEAIAADERAKQHHVLASRITESMMRNGKNGHVSEVKPLNGVEDFLLEIVSERSLSDLILPDGTQEICQQVVQEHHRADILKSYNLEPRNRILLVGPPGNGKTSLAEAFACELMVPMYVIRYERVIGSFLGETAQRLSRVFDYVRTRNCVLFFDEFDTLGKERGDTKETGEIKRVVSSLLLQIDSLPSHVVVVAATNHSELLDKAVWRRFQVRVQLPTPTRSQLTRFFEEMCSRFDHSIGLAPSTLAQKLLGISYAEAEEFALDVQRQYVLSLPEGDLTDIAKNQMGHWQVKRSIGNTDVEERK